MFRLLLRDLLADRRMRRIVLPILGVGLIAAVAGVALSAWQARVGSPTDRAEALAARGDLDGAETLWCETLADSFDFEVYFRLVELQDARRRFPFGDPIGEPTFGLGSGVDPEAPGLPVPEEPEPLRSEPACVDADGVRWDLLEAAAAASGGAGREVALLWQREVAGTAAEELRSAVETLADREESPRWTNHVLGRIALREMESMLAAGRFDREGRGHPGVASEDLRRALEIWARLEATEELRARRDDPLYADAWTLRLRTALAEQEEDWATFATLIWPASFEGSRLGPILLAVVAGLLWFAFVARLGQVRDDLGPRIALYTGAFLLGILSIYPTLLVITLQDTVLGWAPTGEPLGNALYYVFGVGFREELCKLLLFLPLLPLLLRRGSRLEALTCGAMVGLGFAAEENVSYFHQGAGSTAIARFLTANFLHMALTGTIAAAVFDAARQSRHRPQAGGEANSAFAMAVLLHGAYDFLLGMGEYSFFAMTVFILLSQVFLRQVVASRSVAGQDLMRQFALSLAILAGAAWIYASALYGLGPGFGSVLQGFLGVAVLIFMFERELG